MLEDLKLQLSQNKARTKALELQHRMYTFTGLPTEKIKSGDLYINDSEYIHYTEIDLTPKAKNNTLVLLHGYGGANVMFYRMVKHLAQEFHLVAIDLPGMALSSRHDTTAVFKDTKSCLNYFVDRLDKFFDKAGLEKFHLAGHSIGSYLATHYFDRNDAKVMKLIMLSPAGFNHIDEDHNAKIEERINNLPILRRTWMRHVRNKIFNEKRSIIDLLWFPWKKYMIRKYFSNPRYNFSQEELDTLIDYTYCIFSMPPSGDRCLGYLLEQSVKSPLPSINIIEKYRHRIADMVIMYGMNDYMDIETTCRELNTRNLSVRIDKIENSDHQIINQNAKQVSELITKFITKTIEN